MEMLDAYKASSETNYYIQTLGQMVVEILFLYQRKTFNDKKNYSIIIFSTVGSYLSAETVAYKLKGELKSSGLESIEVASTPLVDDKVITKSKEQIITIVSYAESQSKIITKKNRSRKPRPKFKGGPEEIFEKFANSVVYIENKKDQGSGSGFVINHKRIKNNYKLACC